MSPTMVGREAQTRALTEACERALRNGCTIVHVVGPQGIGKSLLLDHLAHAMDGWTVASATADESESSVAFGVVDQLLRQLQGEAEPGALAGRELASVGSLLVGALDAAPGGIGSVLIVDDAQWTDTPSLLALGFARRRLPTEPVVMIFATPETAAVAPDRPLGRLLRGPWAQTLRVPGLDRSGVRLLLAELGFRNPGEVAVQRLREHTGGNPLHLRALVTELGDGVLAPPAAGTLPAPQDYAELVARRVAGCSGEARLVVEAASVIGQRFSLASVTSVSEVADVAAAIDELVHEGLLVASPAHRFQFEFAHPLIRAAVYHGLGLARRAALHRRAAGAATDHLLSLRHRAAAQTRANAALSQELVAAANDAAGAGNWLAAAETLDAAVELTADLESRSRLQLDAIDCLISGLDVAEASARWDGLPAAGEPASRAEYVAGRLALASGRSADARSLLLHAAQVCPPEDRELWARIAASLAVVYVNNGDGRSSRTWASRAIESGASGALIADPPVGTLVIALAIMNRHRQALRLAAQANAADGRSALDTLTVRGIVHLWSGALREALADLTQASATKTAWLHARVLALVYLADVEFRLGLWDDATTHAELAASLAQDVENPRVARMASCVASFPLACRGRWADAEAHIATARSLAGDELGAQLFTAVAVARLAHARGDHEAVITALLPMSRLRRLDGVRSAGVQPWQSLLIEALATSGRVAEAQVELDASAAALGAGSGGLALARARTLVLEADGRRADAEAALAIELEGSDQEPPLDRALAELTLGGLQRRLGRRRAASAALTSARQRLARLGADPYLRDCDRELAACGLKPSRGEDRARDRLTPQELSVAHLVATGMSNREVAGELVISVKTVEFHLGNVFGKLGVTSRAKLARLWREP